MARIITIARGYGSGGKTIGKMLAEDLGIKFYDKELIKLASEESGINEGFFGVADEKVKLPRLRKGGAYKGDDVISPDSPDFVSDQNLFNYTAKIIKQIAEKEPCVIVGRCADYILKERDDVIRIFIHCDEKTAISNICDMYGIDEKEALKTMNKKNKDRADYYRYYTGQDWQNADNYNLCINTSHMSYEKCVEIIKKYLELIG